MRSWIPDSHADQLQDDKQGLAALSTAMPEGNPQATPVWFDIADGRLRAGISRGRVKDPNTTVRPVFALRILDTQNPNRYLQVRGPVVGVDGQGRRAHIDRWAKKCTGASRYAGSATEQRVVYISEPRHAQAMGQA